MRSKVGIMYHGQFTLDYTSNTNAYLVDWYYNTKKNKVNVVISDINRDFKLPLSYGYAWVATRAYNSIAGNIRFDLKKQIKANDFTWIQKDLEGNMYLVILERNGANFTNPKYYPYTEESVLLYAK